MNPIPNPSRQKNGRQNILSLSFLAAHLFAGLLVPSASAQSPANQQRLTDLQASYEKAVAEKATAPYLAAVAELNQKYSAAIDRLTTAATQAGDLDTALALREEKSRLLPEGTLPEDAETLPAALKAARATYRQQITALQATRDAAAQPFKDHYRTLLQTLLTQTTQAGKLDEALIIREKIASLSSGTFAPTAEAPTLKPTAPSSSSKLNVAKSTGKTDPEAARQIIAWALANGSTVTTSLGVVGPEEKLKTAPAGKYSVTEISMGPTSEGFPWSALEGLGQLTRLTLGTERALTEAETQHFRHLGGLRVMSIGPVTEAGLQAMPQLPNLIELQVSPNQEDLPFLQLLQERTQSVTKLVISYKRIGKDADAVFAALSGWQELKEVHSFISIKTTLAQHLARLPKLTRLYLFTGSTIEEGCLSLMPQLTTVNFNSKQSPAILREVSSLRNLGWFSFDMEGLSFADFPDLSGCPKLLKIEVENPPGPSSDIIAKCSFVQGLYSLKLVKTEIDETAVERLLKFKRLNILQLVKCRFSAPAIEKLQSLKQPKEIDLRDSNITEGDFKALQKALPKCKVIK